MSDRSKEIQKMLFDSIDMEKQTKRKRVEDKKIKGEEKKPKKVARLEEKSSGDDLEWLSEYAETEMPQGKDKIRGEKDRYYTGKSMIKIYERTNFSKMYLLQAERTSEVMWHKVFGNSALFYRFLIGPMLHKTIKMNIDKEGRENFPEGVAYIRDLEKFVDGMEKLGYDNIKLRDFGIIEVDLKREFTAKEIKEFRAQLAKRFDLINKMVNPQNSYPELYNAVLGLSCAVPAKVNRMKSAIYRDTLGKAMVESSKDMLLAYLKFANGRLEVAEIRQRITDDNDIFIANLRIAAENNYVDEVAAQKLGELSAKVTMVVGQCLKEKK